MADMGINNPLSRGLTANADTPQTPNARRGKLSAQPTLATRVREAMLTKHTMAEQRAAEWLERQGEEVDAHDLRRYVAGLIGRQPAMDEVRQLVAGSSGDQIPDSRMIPAHEVARILCPRGSSLRCVASSLPQQGIVDGRDTPLKMRAGEVTGGTGAGERRQQNFHRMLLLGMEAKVSKGSMLTRRR